MQIYPELVLWWMRMMLKLLVQSGWHIENAPQRIVVRRKERRIVMRLSGRRRREIMRREQPLPLCHLQPCGQLLLPLCAPILEPGFNLHLSQIKCFWQLHAFTDAQIFINLKFRFEFLKLLCWIGLTRFTVESGLPRSTTRRFRSCKSI